MCAAVKVTKYRSKIMTNQNDRDLDQQQPKSNDTANQSGQKPSQQSGQNQPHQQDPSKKTPVHESGTSQQQQDSSRKDSSQADDSHSRGNEGSEPGEKRRAS
jgi:hypothetical protein